MHIWTVIMSQTMTDMSNIAIANSHVAFRFAYLHWTLVLSKGQGQGYAHFDCEYLGNEDI